MSSSAFAIPPSARDGVAKHPLDESCRLIGEAIKAGDLGNTVAEVQKLILRYYGNVSGQADASFKSAKKAAWAGFGLLMLTILYVMVMDSKRISVTGGIGVGSVGLIGSALVEAIAGLQFWLYGRATKQFGAFHICLERTNRYLIAYQMAQQIVDGKDRTLEELVCIMANAPMITRADIDGPEAIDSAKTRIELRRNQASSVSLTGS